jgi:hypothetical protein
MFSLILALFLAFPQHSKGPHEFVAHRTRISSGEVVLDSKVSYFREDGEVERLIDQSYHLWFDQKIHRVDKWQAYEGVFKAGEHFFEGWFFDGEEYAYYTDEEHPDGGKSASFVSDKVGGESLFTFYDPRLIGVSPDTYLQCAVVGLDHIIDNPLFEVSGDVVTEKIGEHDCDKFVYRLVNGDSTVTFWLDPKMNYQARRITAEYNSVSEECDIQLMQVAGVGAFPQFCEYKRFENKNLRKSETLDIVVKQFNQPIDNGLFSFGVWNPPEGLEMVDKRPGRVGYVVWKDGEIRSSPEEIQAKNKPVGNPRGQPK